MTPVSGCEIFPFGTLPPRQGSTTMNGLGTRLRSSHQPGSSAAGVDVRRRRMSPYRPRVEEVPMAGSGLRVAIVGAGIGGLSLALALRERGLRAEVFEQAAELTEIG